MSERPSPALPARTTSATPPSSPSSASSRTPWSWVRDTPLTAFIRTETGSAMLLLAVTVLALLWVAIAPASYAEVWEAPLSIQLGDVGISQDLRGWINNGLMTFFFFVIGLEARRSIDIGDLRERSRVLLPLLAGVGGMLTSISIYLLINAGEPAAQGWGIAMSTDTAFALGLLSPAGAKPLLPLRSFMLTVVVVDDVLALVVIAVFYSDRVELVPLLVGVLIFS
ncbi:MAG: Na+/H+ antiporter NhaA, partial [Propionibacteriaceae bacterium]